MKTAGLAMLVCVVACGGSPPAPVEPASVPPPSSAASAPALLPVAVTPVAPSGTVVVRPTFKGGEHGDAAVDIECTLDHASHKEPKAKKVKSPRVHVDLAWKIESDATTFVIAFKRVTTTPKKLDKSFKSLSRVIAERPNCDGKLEADRQGKAQCAYGPARLFSEDVLTLMDTVGDLVKLALVLHLPDGPVKEGEEWSDRRTDPCGGPSCETKTKSKLGAASGGHVVVETKLAFESVDKEWGGAKIPVWRGEEQIVREVVPGSLLSTTTFDVTRQLELEAPKRWSKSKTICHATLRN